MAGSAHSAVSQPCSSAGAGPLPIRCAKLACARSWQDRCRSKEWPGTTASAPFSSSPPDRSRRFPVSNGPMSALPRKADHAPPPLNSRFVPKLAIESRTRRQPPVGFIISSSPGPNPFSKGMDWKGSAPRSFVKNQSFSLPSAIASSTISSARSIWASVVIKGGVSVSTLPMVVLKESPASSAR